MKLKSFGCSFVYGNDLSDDSYGKKWAQPSQLTWPALVADQLGRSYECYAKPGAGNLYILQQVLTQSALEQDNTVYIINWTWSERFDYIISAGDHAREKWETLCPISTSRIAKEYYKNFHSELQDKLTSLVYIKSAIDCLEQKNIKFFMTYMDDIIFDRRWHAPISVSSLQDQVMPYMNSFDGTTFLNWSRQHNFAISETLHPLDPAHRAACDYILPKIKNALDF